MNFTGSKRLETKQLILHKTEERDLKELWSILCLDSVNKYYLTTKFNLDWEKEKPWQVKKLEKASNLDVFCWTIELKETGEIIGQISVHERSLEDATCTDKSIRGIGWYLDTLHQKKGYASAAAWEILRYMFLEVDINKIIIEPAINNPSSWKLMEFLGFKRQKETSKLKYTFLDKEEDCYNYTLTKKDFIKELFRKENLYITEDIDKDPYIKHISDDLVINLTGESGSGKTTAAKKYLNDPNCVVIDTDQVFSNHEKDENNQEVYNMLVEKYGTLPDIYNEFDRIYLDIVNYYKDSGKTLIIDSALFRLIKDEQILVGNVIVVRTCINTCFERCLNRYKENHPNATFEEIATYSNKKRRIYTWYHNLNRFIDRIDKID